MHLVDNEKYISFEEFVRNSGVSERTVRKRYREIPGIELTDSGEFRVLSGTRYPFNMRNCKLEDSADRRYILLKAISQYKYISYDKLKIQKEQFEQLIGDLLGIGLIRRNNLPNDYGANGYDCTMEGIKYLRYVKNCKSKVREEILLVMAKISGAFFKGYTA